MQAAVLTSTLETREGCTFAPQLVCKLPSADEFRWAVHVLATMRVLAETLPPVQLKKTSRIYAPSSRDETEGERQQCRGGVSDSSFTAALQRSGRVAIVRAEQRRAGSYQQRSSSRAGAQRNQQCAAGCKSKRCPTKRSQHRQRCTAQSCQHVSLCRNGRSFAAALRGDVRFVSHGRHVLVQRVAVYTSTSSPECSTGHHAGSCNGDRSSARRNRTGLIAAVMRPALRQHCRSTAVAVLGDWSWSTVEVLGRRRGMVRVWSAGSRAP